MGSRPSIILNHANLKGVDLKEVDLRRADLRYANLENANLTQADLQEAKLEGTNLVNTVLVGAIFSNSRGLNKSCADLTQTNLTGANLTDAILVYCDLRNVILTGANFQNANLQGARLEDVDITGINFDNANLKGVYFDKSYPETEIQTKIRLELSLELYKVPTENQTTQIHNFIGTKVDGSEIIIKLHLQNYHNQLEDKYFVIGFFTYNDMTLKLKSFSKKDDPPQYFANVSSFWESLTETRKNSQSSKLTQDGEENCWKIMTVNVDTCGTHWSVYTSYIYTWKFDLENFTAHYHLESIVDTSQ